MITSKDNILSLIPQRPPFVMIDELIYSDERMSRTGLLVREDNIFVRDQRFREPGLVENIAQAAAARMGYVSQIENRPVPVGYIGSVKNLEILELPRLGDKLETEIIIENQVFDVTVISGKVSCNNRLLAQCEMKIFITK